MAAAKEKAESTMELHGITFPSTLFIKDIQDTMRFNPMEGDILIASYPNTGEEWIQHIVLNLVGRAHDFAGPNMIYKIVPVLERSGVKVTDSLYEPRIYRHHLPYHMMKKSHHSKCIYVYRNPEDTFASYYCQMSRNGVEKLPLETAFEKFSSGRKMEYGRYFEHARSFFGYRDSSNMLLVSFDKLLHSHKEEVLKIAKYIQKDFHDYLLQNDSALETLLKNTTYEKIPRPGHRPHESSFSTRCRRDSGSRKDEPLEFVGGGQKLLSTIQIQKLYDTSAQVWKALNH